MGERNSSTCMMDNYDSLKPNGGRRALSPKQSDKKEKRCVPLGKARKRKNKATEETKKEGMQRLSNRALKWGNKVLDDLRSKVKTQNLKSGSECPGGPPVKMKQRSLPRKTRG